MADPETKCLRDFIALYKKMPCLWDKTHNDYHNRRNWAAAYDRLISKLREIDPLADKYSVARKIRSLRTSFGYQHRKVLMNKALGMDYTPKLWCYDLMLFTISSDPLADIKSNFTSEIEYLDTEYMEVDDVNLAEVNTKEDDLKSEVKNEFEGVCQCCLGDANLKSMLEPEFKMGRIEVYAEMLQEVYPSFKYDGSNGIETQYLICLSCIHRLRMSISFLDEVKRTQNILSPISNYAETENDTILLDGKECRAETDDEFKISSSKKRNSASSKTPLLNRARPIKLRQVLKLSNELRIKSRDPTMPKTVLEKSLRLKPEELKCDLCNIKFTAYFKLCRHMAEQHYPNFTCETCGMNYVTWDSLRSHMMIRHRNERINCKICNKSLMKTSLKRHMWTHTEGGYKYRCRRCPAVFPNHDRKMKHMVEDHGVKPVLHKCEICYKDFPTNAALSHHVKRTHLKVKNVACEFCGKLFYSKSSLNRHMVKHTGERNYVCRVCSKRYSTQSTLRQHMFTHEKLKRFTCSYCDKQFTYKCILKNHLRTHEHALDTLIKNVK